MNIWVMKMELATTLYSENVGFFSIKATYGIKWTSQHTFLNSYKFWKFLRNSLLDLSWVWSSVSIVLIDMERVIVARERTAQKTIK